MQTLRVGGSIRQCQKYLVNHCVEQLLYIQFKIKYHLKFYLQVKRTQQ